jgi:hypothetical protein
VKFEAGDMVKVVKKPAGEWDDWVREMDKTIGTILKVESMTSDGEGNDAVLLDNAFYYPPESLEIVSDTPPAPAPAESILDEARRVVDGPRRETYGHPRENHARTAAMWTAYLGKKLLPGATISMRDVCQLNSLQKISRDANAPHRDNLVDQAGWARNAEMVTE